jgi:hypothetical protein
MSNDLTQQNYPADDGWGDAAAEGDERTIRGTLLKFADWRWTAGKEGTHVPDGTRLVAMAVAAGWFRWEGGMVVERRMRRPGERMAEREDLGFNDEAAWEDGPGGEPQDPWRNTRLIYMADPATAEAFTFSTSSYGGREAVIALGDTIQRMRRAHPDAVPIVELRSAEKPTKWGKKSKPVLKVVGWKTASAEGIENAKPAIAERVMPPEEVKRVEGRILNQEIDDEIPF